MKIAIFIFVMLLTTVFASAELMDCRCDCSQSSVAIKNQDTFRRGLEISLITLAVLLVILGLFVGYSRFKKHNDEGENYY